MSFEKVTLESFEEWKHHPVTKRFMKVLKDDREAMKEGLADGAFEDEVEIKGRCRVIAVILDTQYEDLFQTK
jgi:hypothetical protein